MADKFIMDLTGESLEKARVESYEKLAQWSAEQVKKGKVSELFGVNIPDMGTYYLPTVLDVFPSFQELLKRSFGGRAFKRGLDLGCGDSTFFNYFRVPESVLIDIAPTNVNILKASGWNVIQANVECLSVPIGDFDIIVTSDLLEHVVDLQATLREIGRVSRPGCVWLVNVPWEQSEAGISKKVSDFKHLRSFSDADVKFPGWREFIRTFIPRKIVDRREWIASMSLLYVKE